MSDNVPPGLLSAPVFQDDGTGYLEVGSDQGIALRQALDVLPLMDRFGELYGELLRFSIDPTPDPDPDDPEAPAPAPRARQTYQLLLQRVD